MFVTCGIFNQLHALVILTGMCSEVTFDPY